MQTSPKPEKGLVFQSFIGHLQLEGLFKSSYEHTVHSQPRALPVKGDFLEFKNDDPDSFLGSVGEFEPLKCFNPMFGSPRVIMIPAKRNSGITPSPMLETAVKDAIPVRKATPSPNIKSESERFEAILSALSTALNAMMISAICSVRATIPPSNATRT